MRIVVFEPGEPARIDNIEPDEKGSYLRKLQELVGGMIEPVSVLYGNQPMLWVNDSGLVDELPLNRAIIANEDMEKRGCRSWMGTRAPVRKGDTYTILAGTIVACSYDRDSEGEEVMRDITDEEIELICGSLCQVFPIPKYTLRIVDSQEARD